MQIILWISNCSRSRLKKCCSIWRFRQMVTGSQQQVDSLNRSAQRDLSLQFAMELSSVTSDCITGSTRFCLSLEHLSRFSTKSSICLLRPGHQTDYFVRSLHFVIHLCPSWILPRIVVCMATGITRRLPMSSNPFWIVRSAATCRCSFSPDPSFALSVHPCMHNSWMF